MKCVAVKVGPGDRPVQGSQRMIGAADHTHWVGHQRDDIGSDLALRNAGDANLDLPLFAGSHDRL